ncbi:hypothetical protein RJT34_18066 [Clitoria ternatea]|uniref:Uncharacterized protein n=1 Tax=Clitoria ternatea TaxID=43366 RepID=A0AAN9PE96_CLITE
MASGIPSSPPPSGSIFTASKVIMSTGGNHSGEGSRFERGSQRTFLPQNTVNVTNSGRNIVSRRYNGIRGRNTTEVVINNSQNLINPTTPMAASLGDARNLRGNYGGGYSVVVSTGLSLGGAFNTYSSTVVHMPPVRQPFPSVPMNVTYRMPPPPPMTNVMGDPMLQPQILSPTNLSGNYVVITVETTQEIQFEQVLNRTPNEGQPQPQQNRTPAGLTYNPIEGQPQPQQQQGHGVLGYHPYPQDSDESSSSRNVRRRITMEDPPQQGSSPFPAGQGSTNPQPRPIPNSLYDPAYEAMGLPVDPHLRAFQLMRNRERGPNDEANSN